MKSESEIMAIEFNINDEIARVIYESIFQRDETYRPWSSVPYCAPETREYFAARVCIETVNTIREKYEII